MNRPLVDVLTFDVTFVIRDIIMLVTVTQHWMLARILLELA